MGYGGLGGALPQAIGAKLACPDRTVLCVIGDGGFQFTAPELAVAVQENVALTIVVCNNGKYGAIEANMRKNFGHASLGCELVNPDFLTFASAYGVPAVRVDALDGFAEALETGLRANALNLIELTIDLCDPPW
jgi:acetolactate synthase-1/2/3 large subunit